MKMLVTIGWVIFSSYIISGCSKNEILDNEDSPQKCFKGILVKKGICGERVIKIISENRDGLSYTAQWKDEAGKSYENVFAVDNSCAFPAAISEGAEFNFKLTAAAKNDCVRCAAHTPVPAEKNSIVISTDCTEQK